MYGRAVGAGTLIASGGVAGVYNVATVPSARRQGVAAAVMGALHEHALELGYPGTALASSSMGIPLYDRLGYRSDGFQFAWVPMFEGV
jgi:GNAT superfamily N-acetyltransferase